MSYSTTNEAPPKSPEQRLWIAVVTRAVQDAKGKCSPRECAEARIWLQREENKMRTIIFDMADVDERMVRQWALTLPPLLNIFPDLDWKGLTR